MLMEDVIGSRLILEFSEPILNQAINSFILKARMNNIKEIKVSSLIQEIGKEFPDIYLNPKDLEIRNKISEILKNNNWAEVVADTIKITMPGEITSTDNIDNNSKQEKKAFNRKMQKIATKNIKADNSNSGIKI